MPRVAGIDPGTLSLDLCGLEDGRLFLDASWPTAELLADPAPLVAALQSAGPFDLVVGPSGYGLPLRAAGEATEEDLRLAYLAAPHDPGGIGGVRGLARRLTAMGLPLFYTPGVAHLDTVPRHRKLNRVDLGTADKVAAAALAIHDQAIRRDRSPDQVSVLVLELGGAFTAGVAVQRGQIVDGIGGTSGPIGWRSAGALDGEVAFLAGSVTKELLFRGGVETITGHDAALAEVALEAYVEGACRAALVLASAAPEADEILLSGRMATDSVVGQRIADALARLGRVLRLGGFGARAKHGAQGAAILADGLAGGTHRALVERMRIREARGTVLDHLHVISPAEARRRLGIGSDG